jgi:hypothetical protein
MSTVVKTCLFVAAVGLLLSASSAAAVAATPDKYLPDNAEMVLSVDVRALLDSAVVKQHAEKEINDLLAKTEVANVLKLISLDPRKDVVNLTVCVGKIEVDIGGGRPDGKAEVLAILRGKYQPEKLHSALADFAKNEPGKLAVSDYSGLKVYEGKEGDRPMFAAVLDTQTIVASDKKSSITGAIDRSQGKGQAKVSKEFAAILEKADSKKTVWLAMIVPGAVKDLAKVAPQGGEVLEKVDGITLGTSISEGVKAELKIHTSDEGAAAMIRQGVEQGKGLLAVSLLQNKDVGPLLMPVVNGIKVADEKGKIVTITAEADAGTIEKLVKKAKEGGQ